MNTRVDEINDGIYRLSTMPPGAPIVFDQFLIDADEPLLFHTGMRGLFPFVSEAAATVVPLDRLRWISFGHFESDECGALNDWLDAAPNAQAAHTAIGCLVSVDDFAIRPPRPLNDGEVLDLGGKRVRHLATPHVPHAWDSGLLYEETTGTLLCGDLFTMMGDCEPLVEDDDLVGPAAAAEEAFNGTSLTPMTAPTIRTLAELEPTTLALMHGPSYKGDCAGQLNALADYYQQRVASAA